MEVSVMQKISIFEARKQVGNATPVTEEVSFASAVRNGSQREQELLAQNTALQQSVKVLTDTVQKQQEQMLAQQEDMQAQRELIKTLTDKLDQFISRKEPTSPLLPCASAVLISKENETSVTNEPTTSTSNFHLQRTYNCSN